MSATSKAGGDAPKQGMPFHPTARQVSGKDDHLARPDLAPKSDAKEAAPRGLAKIEPGSEDRLARPDMKRR